MHRPWLLCAIVQDEDVGCQAPTLVTAIVYTLVDCEPYSAPMLICSRCRHSQARIEASVQWH